MGDIDVALGMCANSAPEPQLLDLHFSFSPLGSGVLRSYVAIDSSELSRDFHPRQRSKCKHHTHSLL